MEVFVLLQTPVCVHLDGRALHVQSVYYLCASGVLFIIFYTLCALAHCVFVLDLVGELVNTL